MARPSAGRSAPSLDQLVAPARQGAGGGRRRAAQVILLLTDGEDTESEPLEAADEASKLGVKIFTVGIGSRSGELIPEYDEQGKVTGYVKDADGKYVTSRLGEDDAVEIAQKTGGEYLHADAQALRRRGVGAALAGLKRTENEARLVKDTTRSSSCCCSGVPAAGGRGCMSERAAAARSAGGAARHEAPGVSLARWSRSGAAAVRASSRVESRNARASRRATPR